MSKLTDLLRQVERRDPQLAADLEREYITLSSRRAFGLNFERHHPESTEIPGRKVRKGEKVRILPHRGSLDASQKTLWVVQRIERVDGGRVAHLVGHGADNSEIRVANVDDLVVVAVFRDFIYPGLASTGKAERGGEKPFHTVINGENFHALEALTYTHRGKINAIYIDPPYNTGAKDWKYNNDYVEGDDLYRHSKWLAFIERRLLIARKLLNPEDSVLIVTIDEKEVHRLGLLLEQIFPEARAQLVTVVINAPGQARNNELARVDEYAFMLFFGAAQPVPGFDDLLNEKTSHNPDTVRWSSLLRSGTNSGRADRPTLFFPIFVDPESNQIVGIGETKGLDASRDEWEVPAGAIAVWPLKSNDSEGRWRASPDYIRNLINQGCVRMGALRAEEGRGTVWYLGKTALKKIETGEFRVTGQDESGAVLVEPASDVMRRTVVPKTVWNRASHHAGWHGSALVRALLPGRTFPFPKSLYVVEDAIRIAVGDKPNATVLDFFAGSGTSAHAVMRLNRQDGGRRQCISVTNNEVAADEQKILRENGLRPGDPEWEQWGICDYITTPRIKAAITGRTPDGDLIKGDYKFVDEFSMSEGFEENAEFFTLTYETRTEVAHHKAFRQIAPLLWLRAGARGERIETEPDAGWALAEAYGVLIDLDASTAFIETVKAACSVGVAYIVTDDERRFQAVARRLPEGVEAVRLYESYLRNFQIRNGG